MISKKITKKYINDFTDLLFGCCRKDYKKPLLVNYPPAPEEVIWENIGYPNSYRV
jgi:hypothetical protein